MICASCGLDGDISEIEFEDEMPICHGCIFERDYIELQEMGEAA